MASPSTDRRADARACAGRCLASASVVSLGPSRPCGTQEAGMPGVQPPRRRLYRAPPPLPKARGRLGPCGHAPAECLRCLFAPWSGELTLALVQDDNARPRGLHPGQFAPRGPGPQWGPPRTDRAGRRDRRRNTAPDREVNARPRRSFCWDLPALAERKKAACPVRPRTTDYGLKERFRSTLPEMPGTVPLAEYCQIWKS